MENKKGKLKIFFGYSAGVGKTYAMLKAAQELKKDGGDVVIGYLEPHDRADTIKMAEGLKTLPLNVISYKGITIKEFDVDKAIRQKHQLVLVDELAHTNAPSSKNAKRYLDVEELINNGIDVWTTVNVQHIESLHDLVDAETSVDVSERIPDEIFDYADAVVLIDIEPTDLMQRMKEGKIYSNNRAKTALQNFFNNDNLMSLRELFMRRGAERIEKKSHFGEVPTKVLVLISPSPSSAKNIRFAARMAEAYRCKYSAMYVETDGELNDESAENLKKHMQLVRDTGGELIVKYSDDVVDTVACYVKTAGITDLIIGKTWQSVGKKVGLEDKFVARLPKLAIVIIPDENHTPKRHYFSAFISKFFGHKRLQEQFRLTNKILDIINMLLKSVKVKTVESNIQKAAEVLGVAFERSCLIMTENKKVVYQWNNEVIGFFDETNEKAVAKWCEKNGKPAGIGTDTLRQTKAIYFPVILNEQTIAVIAFSCLRGKLSVTEKIILYELMPICKTIL